MKNSSKNETTLSELVDFLVQQPNSRPKVIAEHLGVSRQYVQKLLAKHNNLFIATGIGPNRFYRLKETDSSGLKSQPNTPKLQDNKINEVIDSNFYSLTPLGEELIGVDGFERWCIDRNLNIDQKKQEYVEIINKYYPKDLSRPIDFTPKLRSVFNNLALRKVWAVDYYTFEVFGKTKLGLQVMISKQTGDSITTQTLVEKCEDALNEICKVYQIDALAFVSPTVQRQEQLMSRLESGVAKDLPRIKVYKVGARMLIAQETLKSLKDRILNAQQTFVVESSKNYENILIIDDVLDSGATLQEISKQIILKKIAKNCYGLVLVASPSGYEVIQDV